MINLDTHCVVALVCGTLTARETTCIAGQQGGISAIVWWELAMLQARGRIAVDFDDLLVQDRLARLHVWPLDLAVSRQAMRLDFTSDPADELIAATSIVHHIPLLTRDRTIRRSKLVPLA